MKRFVTMICGCCLFISVTAQINSLKITTNKTTSLIFPFPILHVDRGSKDVLTEAVKEPGNILLVKAACKQFPETNLSVVTSDGTVYSFEVNYIDHPDTSIYYLPESKVTTIATYANGILDNPSTMKAGRDHKWEMESRVPGIYIKDDVIYFQLLLSNHSSIDYGIDQLRFYTRDRKLGKRTAVQENEKMPMYLAGNVTLVKAKSENRIVVAIEKFTIPDSKYFAVQVSEKNGGRQLLMKMKNKWIMRAIPLADRR